VTPVAQLRLQVRSLAKRVEALEAKRRRTPAPPPDDAESQEREHIWSQYRLAVFQRSGRWPTKCGFAGAVGLSEREFRRWLSKGDKRGVPKGASVDRRARAELAAKDSPGTRSHAPLFRVRRAV
jgi:hypothetical protein